MPSGVIHGVQMQGESTPRVSFGDQWPSTFAALFAEQYARSVRLAHLLTGSDVVAQDLVPEG